MIAHHFTSRKNIEVISVMGLTRGVIPMAKRDKVPGMNGPQMEWAQGFQWLTQNGDWNQPWCGRDDATKLSPDHLDYRITVSIPDEVSAKLCVRWLDFCAKMQPPMAPEINKIAHGDENQWFIFQGVLPATTFLSISRNPSFVDQTAVKVVFDGRGRPVRQ